MNLNDDGSGDIYFGKLPPKGLELNGIPNAGEDAFFYGSIGQSRVILIAVLCCLRLKNRIVISNTTRITYVISANDELEFLAL